MGEEERKYKFKRKWNNLKFQLLINACLGTFKMDN